MSRAVVGGFALATALLLTWATLMWVVWPKDATGHGDPAVKGLTYDEAIDQCGWISAADNVECFVIPDGDMWQALPGGAE